MNKRENASLITSERFQLQPVSKRELKYYKEVIDGIDLKLSNWDCNACGLKSTQKAPPLKGILVLSLRPKDT